MSYFVKFRIDDLPKTRNQLTYGKRYDRVKEKDKWLQLVAITVGNKIPKKPITLAEISLKRASSSLPDYDGLVSSFKYVIDALVKLDILKDDNLKILPNPTYEWTRVKRNEGYIEVCLKEIVSTEEIQNSKDG